MINALERGTMVFKEISQPAEGSVQERSVSLSRIEGGLRGWETADAAGLNQRKEQLTQIYAGITLGDLIVDKKYWQQYPQAERFWPLVDRLSASLGQDTALVDIYDEYFHPITINREQVPLVNGQTYLANREIGNFLERFPLLEPFTQWLEEKYRQADTPQQQARLSYLAFAENPFIKVHQSILLMLRSFEQECPSIFEDLDKETLKKAVVGLNEIMFSAEADFPHAWAYTRDTCQDFQRVLSSRSIRKTPLAGENQKFCFGEWLLKNYFNLSRLGNAVIAPAQLEYVAFVLKEKLGVKSFQEALERLYKHGQNITDYVQELNYVVAGHNRTFDLWSLKGRVKPGTLLSVFSGPTEVAREKAVLLGLGEAVTVDRASEETLSGGIIPYEIMFPEGSALQQSPILDTSGIASTHHQIRLPASLNRFKDLPLSIAEDMRGSLLYLKDQELLDHLEELFSLGSEGTIFAFSIGMSRYFLVDLYLQKQADAILLMDYKPTLSTEKRAQAGILQDYPKLTMLEDLQRLFPDARQDPLKLEKLKRLGEIILTEITNRRRQDNVDDGYNDALFVVDGIYVYREEYTGGALFLLSLSPNLFSVTIAEPSTRLKAQYAAEVSDFQSHFDRQDVMQLISLVSYRLGITTARQGFFYPKTVLRAVERVVAPQILLSLGSKSAKAASLLHLDAYLTATRERELYNSREIRQIIGDYVTLRRREADSAPLNYSIFPNQTSLQAWQTEVLASSRARGLETLSGKAQRQEELLQQHVPNSAIVFAVDLQEAFSGKAVHPIVRGKIMEPSFSERELQGVAEFFYQWRRINHKSKPWIILTALMHGKETSYERFQQQQGIGIAQQGFFLAQPGSFDIFPDPRLIDLMQKHYLSGTITDLQLAPSILYKLFLLSTGQAPYSLTEILSHKDKISDFCYDSPLYFMFKPERVLKGVENFLPLNHTKPTDIVLLGADGHRCVEDMAKQLAIIPFGQNPANIWIVSDLIFTRPGEIEKAREDLRDLAYYPNIYLAPSNRIFTLLSRNQIDFPPYDSLGPDLIKIIDRFRPFHTPK